MDLNTELAFIRNKRIAKERAKEQKQADALKKIDALEAKYPWLRIVVESSKREWLDFRPQIPGGAEWLHDGALCRTTYEGLDYIYRMFILESQ